MKGLQSLTGQPSNYWVRYILKEIIDNSLEACDHPEILVDLNINDETTQLSIKDNGPGIPENIIYHIFKDVYSFGGSKRHYKLPTRGQQGNALMTVLGIQSLLNHPLFVISNDRKYIIQVIKNDVLDEYEISIEKEPVENIHGLKIVIEGNLNSFTEYYGDGSVENTVYNTVLHFSELNPQASFIFIKNDEQILSLPQQKSCKMHTLILNGCTTGKSIWFSFEDFQERLKADYRVMPELSIADFIKEFYGLSSYKKQKKVLSKTSLTSHEALSVFFSDKNVVRELTWSLYQAMRSETNIFSKRTLDKTLGSIGKKGMVHGVHHFLKNMYDDPGTLYEALKGIIDEFHNKDITFDYQDFFVYYGAGDVKETDEKVIPFYYELIAVPISSRKYYEHESVLIFGINQSFLYSYPQVDITIKTNKKEEEHHYSILSAFNKLHYPFKIVCNLTCPTVDFQDKGKQTFDLSPFNDVIGLVVGKVIRKIQRNILPKLNKLNEDDELVYENYLEGKAPIGFIKNTVFSLFEDVYNKATENGKYSLLQRQFFYALRPYFISICNRLGYKYTYDSTIHNKEPLELKYNTFQKKVDDYEKNVLGERIIFKDDRGFFVEPHSNKKVDLGTSSIKRYIHEIERGLREEYNNLLFVEKTGFYELLHNDFQLSKKYDIGIIQCKGWANNSVRKLIEEIQRRKPDINLFVLTDFDIAGLGIASNIKKPDELSAIDIFENVTRLGVTLQDVQYYDLPVESVVLKKTMISQVSNSLVNGEITQDEYEFLSKGQRVEINAFTPVELKEYLENKFREYNVKKLIPERDHLEYLEELTLDDEKDSAIKSAIGDFVINATKEKLWDFVIDHLSDISSGDAEKGLERLYDEESLYDAVVNALKVSPVEGWKEINRKELDSRRSDRQRILDDFRGEISKKVRDILKDVKISFDFTNCNFCDSSNRQLVDENNFTNNSKNENKGDNR